MMMTDDDSPGTLMPNISAQNVPPDKNSLDEYLAILEAGNGKDRAAMTPVVTGIAGRRTGLVLARPVHKDEDGFDDLDEFWDQAEAADDKENKRKRGYTPSSAGSSTPFTSPPPLDIDTPAASTVSHGGRARESSMASAASLPLDGSPGREEDEEEEEEGGEEAQVAAAPPAPEVGEGKKAQPPVQKEVITPAPAKPVDPHALFSTDQGPPVSQAPRRLNFLKRAQEHRREEAKEDDDEEEEEEEQAGKKLDRTKKPAKGGAEKASKALKPSGKPEEEEEDEEGKQAADEARRSPAGMRDDDDWGVDGGDADDYFANNDHISPLSSGIKKSPSSKVSGDVEEEEEDEEVVGPGRRSTGKKPRRIVQSEGEEEEQPPSPVAKPRAKTKEKASPASSAKRKMEEKKKGQRKGKREEEPTEDEEDEEEEDEDEDVVAKGDKGRKNRKKDQEKRKEKKAKTPTAKAKKGEAAAKSKKKYEPEPDDEDLMSLSDDGDTSVGDLDDDDEGRSQGDRTVDRSKKNQQITRKLRLSEFFRQNHDEPEEDVPAGVRRSKRRHIAPLQYWKNEREVVTLKDSVPQVDEVILANPTPAASRKRKMRRPHPSKGKKQKRKRGHDDDEDLEDEEEEFDASTLNPDYNYKDGDKAFVWDEEEAGFTEMRVVSYRDKLREMALPVEGDYEAPLASQSFSRTPHGEGCSGWMSGCVRLPPGAVKDAEGVGLCSQVFFVMEAQPKAFEVALARAEETSFNPKTAQRFLLSQGDNFFIPPNNVYRLQNHSDGKDAMVNWVVIRPWPVEGADAESETEAAK